MTEIDLPGSNPVMLDTTAVQDGDDYVVNGHKWYTSSADGAEFAIVMAVTNPNAAPYLRASMIIVPTDTPGFNLVRNIPVMGHAGEDYFSHAEILYQSSRVPRKNLLGPEGQGFADQSKSQNVNDPISVDLNLDGVLGLDVAEGLLQRLVRPLGRVHDAVDVTGGLGGWGRDGGRLSHGHVLWVGLRLGGASRRWWRGWDVRSRLAGDGAWLGWDLCGGEGLVGSVGSGARPRLL